MKRFEYLFSHEDWYTVEELVNTGSLYFDEYMCQIKSIEFSSGTGI